MNDTVEVIMVDSCDNYPCENAVGMNDIVNVIIFTLKPDYRL